MRHLQILCSLLVGFTVVSFSTVSLGQSGAQIFNPFAAFADIFPGHFKSAATARGFSCPASAYGSPEEYCFLKITTGIFSQVGVTISGGIIRQVDFTVRAHALRLGDLILLWGPPHVEAQHSLVMLAWPSIGVMASAPSPAGKFSPLLAVSRVFTVV